MDNIIPFPIQIPHDELVEIVNQAQKDAGEFLDKIVDDKDLPLEYKYAYFFALNVECYKILQHMDGVEIYEEDD